MTNAAYTGPRQVETNVMSVHRTTPGGDERNVRYPKSVRRCGLERALDEISRPLSREVRYRRLVALATNHTADAKLTHQPLHRAACNVEAFAFELPPDLARPVDTKVLDVHAQHLNFEFSVSFGSCRAAFRVRLALLLLVVGRRGNR
jgi:hypothetical protein